MQTSSRGFGPVGTGAKTLASSFLTYYMITLFPPRLEFSIRGWKLLCPSPLDLNFWAVRGWKLIVNKKEWRLLFMLLVLIRVSSYANSAASLSSVPFVVESHPILAVSRNAPPSSLRGGERCVTPKKKKKKTSKCRYLRLHVHMLSSQVNS